MQVETISLGSNNLSSGDTLVKLYKSICFSPEASTVFLRETIRPHVPGIGTWAVTTYPEVMKNATSFGIKALHSC